MKRVRLILQWTLVCLALGGLHTALAETAGGGGRTGELDRFLLSGLEKHGLSFAPEADRAALIRRLSFDLTGLPPAPAEIAAFLADPEPGARERLVEHYLASPHYGERWGRHWLDAAGYADSNGYFHADSDRPLANRYRDYVIDSFNADKPFDRFVQEQLAGDEIAGYVPGGDVTPEMVEPLIATGFLRCAPDGTGESDGNPDEVRTDRLRVLEGTVDIVMSSLQGLTIGCARCHDHKFEPVTQKDYYALQAVFAAAYHPERWLKPAERALAVGTRAEREEHERRVKVVEREVDALKKSLEAAAAPLREELAAEKLAALAEPLRGALTAARAKPAKERTSEEKKLLREHDKDLAANDDDLARRFPHFTTLREANAAAVAAREKERPAPLPAIAALFDTEGEPLPLHLKIRGQHERPGEVVEAGVPAALAAASGPFAVEKPAAGSGRGRRLGFARWVTSPRNRLFARVIVNRIWQHHFGVGIVSTSENLGVSGARPSHPELLDWLAQKFIESGWSVKAMHRLILNSAAFRQASAWRADAAAIDPDDRLLWRFPVLRLDAESLRDAMLCATGELDRRRGGPYVAVGHEADGQVVVDEKTDGALRRSVYLRHRRSEMPTMLSLFDAPAVTTSCPRRTVSTVPLQSLALLNSGFVAARARAFAARLEREAGPLDDARLDDGRIVLAFLLSCGRAPAAGEREAAAEFLAAQRRTYIEQKTGTGQETHIEEKTGAGQGTGVEMRAAAERVWADFCQMVLASNAFLYLD